MFYVRFLSIYSKIKYKINEKLDIGIDHFVLVTSYRLGEETTKNDYAEIRSIALGLFVRYNITGGVHIEGRYGYSFGRSCAHMIQMIKLTWRCRLQRLEMIDLNK
jgi:hypothetical protein